VALALGGAFVVSFALPRAASVRRTPALSAARRSLARREFAVFAACSALSAASSSSYDLCAPLFFRDLGASGDTIGWLYGTAVLAEVVLLACAGAFLGRLSPAQWLGLAYAGAALRWLCMSALSSIGLAFALQPLHAISFALTWTASLEYVRRSSEPQLFGSAQGAFMAANAVGSVVGMLTWGPLYASAGGATVFRVAAALSCGAAFLAHGALARQRALAVPVGASQ
jgi:PPP family 3-phenylpropionic acid transporter